MGRYITENSLPKLAVIILHYGRPELTAKLHRQLMNSDPTFIDDVMVLDNHAPLAYPQAWLRTPKNLYWPGALQLALAEMERRAYSHLWFLNNDLTFISKPPYLSRAFNRLLLAEKTAGPIGLYSPSVSSSLYHQQMVKKQNIQYSLVKYIDGIAPIINIKAISLAGGVDYDDNIYGYGVDIWLSMRITEAGFKLMLDHEVTVRHAHHASATAIPGFMKKAAMAEHDYMTKRFGANWREMVERLKQDMDDRHKL